MKKLLVLCRLAALATVTIASIGCGGGAAFVAAAKPPVAVCNPPNMLVGGACTAPTPAPTASLSVNPGTISKGESTTLTWQTRNATDVSIDGVAVQLNGSESVTPTDSTTYTLTAKGAGGTQKATTMVTVTTPPPPVPKHYLIVDLVPIPGANNSQANAVYHGHAVGYSLLSDGTTRVAFWHDGAADDLGSGYATSINSTDQIVGYTTQSDRTLHATLWDHGIVTDLGLLAGFDMSVANRINDSGEVVGNVFSSQNSANQSGFKWTQQTGMQAIDGSANALGINTKGDIAEMTQSLQAAVFTATGMTIALGTLGDFSVATSINNAGHAAGYPPASFGRAYSCFLL
jgi:probable HAF family extracellular repeat protein